MATATHTLRNLIDGDSVVGEGGETMAVLNPATGEEQWRAPVSSAEEVDRAVRAARRGFERWSQTTPAERSQALLALAATIEQHGEEIARLEALNAG
jgi:acyl-CoA reductase-like NAD-dependent aldehyde dehydrogenase